jgi:hypothetical protein
MLHVRMVFQLEDVYKLLQEDYVPILCHKSTDSISGKVTMHLRRVFGHFGWWSCGATSPKVLQQFLFSLHIGAVQGTGNFDFFVRFFLMLVGTH